MSLTNDVGLLLVNEHDSMDAPAIAPAIRLHANVTEVDPRRHLVQERGDRIPVQASCNVTTAELAHAASEGLVHVDG